ncbi:MAG: right-handed parallel beta-helix repeat-containing protein, partial [SAR202 cluster bacterium]|nr:right-handed parallel beta-helix repeat-containing protein [SAR202 cluster bacterium]
PWTNATSPRATITGAFQEGSSVTAIVEVTSPYVEPDIGLVNVDVANGSTFTRTIDLVALNASTTVVAKLDDPEVNDTCIVPYDLNATDGYRLLLAFREMAGNSNSTVTARVSDVGGKNSQTSGVVNNSLQITPSDLTAGAGPGDTATFSYTVQNNSGVSDTFAISALSAQGWTATTSVPSLNLANGQSGRVDVTVTLDTDTFGPPDCGLVMAKSNANPQRMIAGFFRISRDAHVNGAIGLDQSGRGTTSTPFKTVGYAINQTDAGGRVNIAQGTYAENISLGDTIDLHGGYNSDFSSRSLAQDVTILDGKSADGVLKISGDYGPVIEGLTLKNGLNSDSGGGLRLSGGAAPTVQNNWIVNNTSTLSGGGIYVASSGEFGPTIKDNVISNNVSQSASGGGGGVYVTGRPALIQRNEISGNRATGNSGGGVYLTGDTPAQLLGNRILDNTAVDDGGGVNIRSGNVYAANNIIRGNSADSNGNGVYVSNDSSPTIHNNTVVANNPTSGAGVYASSGSTPKLSNNIISGHVTGVRCGSVFDVRFSILFNDDNDSGSCALVNVIQADPKLTDEFHLGSDSPAIDAGESVSPAPLTDFDGQPRVTDGDCNSIKVIDIGADESAECAPSTVPGLSVWGIIVIALALAALGRRRNRHARAWQ